MGDNHAVHDELVDLGLTRYEARAYSSLVARDRYTAAELARESGIPRQRVYDVLDSLVERGLVTARPGQVVRYSAVDPAVAVDRLLTVHRSTLDRLQDSTARVVDALAALPVTVKILPFLDAEGLYKEFHLDEPWDSENNQKLIDKMPLVFASPAMGDERRAKDHRLTPSQTLHRTAVASSEVGVQRLSSRRGR